MTSPERRKQESQMQSQRKTPLQKKCHADWKDDDRRQIETFIPMIGCFPPYVTPFAPYPQCTDEIFGITKQDFALYTKQFDEEYLEPCRQIEKVLYSYNEYGRNFSNMFKDGSVFELQLNFQGKTFMEIEQLRAYDFQNLFGNVGGYIGVFLGVCFLQLPNLVRQGCNMLTRRF